MASVSNLIRVIAELRHLVIYEDANDGEMIHIYRLIVLRNLEIGGSGVHTTFYG